MHIKRYQSWILAGHIRHPTPPQFPKFQPLPTCVDQPNPPPDRPTIDIKLEVRLSTRLPHRSDFLPRTDLLDRSALPLREHLPDRIRLPTASSLSCSVRGHFFCAATWTPVEIRSTLHLHRDSNLDRIRMGMQLDGDRLSLGQHGLYAMEQPTSNPDRINYRRTRCQFHHRPPQCNNRRCPPNLSRLEKICLTFHVSRFTLHLFASHTHRACHHLSCLRRAYPVQAR